jgi:hypothetical protein
MSDDGSASGTAMRIVLELSSDHGTVSGTLTTTEESRSFWGWLELMSALELATGSSPCEFDEERER